MKQDLPLANRSGRSVSSRRHKTLPRGVYARDTPTTWTDRQGSRLNSLHMYASSTLFWGEGGRGGTGLLAHHPYPYIHAFHSSPSLSVLPHPRFTLCISKQASAPSPRISSLLPTPTEGEITAVGHPKTGNETKERATATVERETDGRPMIKGGGKRGSSVFSGRRGTQTEPCENYLLLCTQVSSSSLFAVDTRRSMTHLSS